MSPSAVSFLLNSPLVDQIFRSISGSVAVSAYEVEAMPLPDPTLIKELEHDLQSGMDYDRFERELEQHYKRAS